MAEFENTCGICRRPTEGKVSLIHELRLCRFCRHDAEEKGVWHGQVPYDRVLRWAVERAYECGGMDPR